ncbi:hypothetical protein V5799_032388 [Amblyomma americanum]|uniref:Uncharacterized protein n=1 Tax=Amblyomma americanum TaxID=6943 RepID=A0AAQ4DRB3_AMBAM
MCRIDYLRSDRLLILVCKRCYKERKPAGSRLILAFILYRCVVPIAGKGSNDPVHVLKCVRNNGLNQRHARRYMYFQDPKSTDPNLEIVVAPFNTLHKLHESEQSEVSKIAATL